METDPPLPLLVTIAILKGTHAVIAVLTTTELQQGNNFMGKTVYQYAQKNFHYHTFHVTLNVTQLLP